MFYCLLCSFVLLLQFAPCSFCRFCFFFSSRRRHTRLVSDWSSDVCSSDLMVLQDPYLFHGTVVENIRYGLPEAPLSDVVRAAQAANAHDFITKLQHGYDTVVGERGHTLSGGERQRLSIARAILHDPRILILDEATSSVDTETEREIQQALERLVAGRTVFAIAHRLSTLRKASRLFVIEDGRLIEHGTHAELLARPEGTYRRPYDPQGAHAIGLGGWGPVAWVLF